jgi:hypothetical protein
MPVDLDILKGLLEEHFGKKVNLWEPVSRYQMISVTIEGTPYGTTVTVPVLAAPVEVAAAIIQDYNNWAENRRRAEAVREANNDKA